MINQIIENQTELQILGIYDSAPRSLGALYPKFQGLRLPVFGMELERITYPDSDDTIWKEKKCYIQLYRLHSTIVAREDSPPLYSE